MPSPKSVLTKIKLNRRPTGIAITPDARRAYVTTVAMDSLAGAVSVIETATNTLVDPPITVGGLSGRADYLAITPDGGHVYVPNMGPGSSGLLNVIDTATNTLVGPPIILGGPGRPTGVAITPDGSRAYVAIQGLGDSGNVTVIDVLAKTIIARIKVSPDPRSVTISPDGGRAYLSLEGDEPAMIDLSTNAVTFAIPWPFPGEFRMAFTPDGHHAYVVSVGGDLIAKVDIASGRFDFVPYQTLNRITDVAVTPDGSRACVTIRPTHGPLDHLVLIDTVTNKLVGPAITWSNGSADAVAVTPGHAYVVDGKSNAVIVVPIPLS